MDDPGRAPLNENTFVRFSATITSFGQLPHVLLFGLQLGRDLRRGLDRLLTHLGALPR